MFLIGEEEERGKKEKGRKELVIEMQMQVEGNKKGDVKIEISCTC
jgi:hypothetical protein